MKFDAKFLNLNKQALKVAPEHLMSSNRLARRHNTRYSKTQKPILLKKQSTEFSAIGK